MLITVSGPGGTGTSALVERLRHSLEQQGRAVSVRRLPRRSGFAARLLYPLDALWFRAVRWYLTHIQHRVLLADGYFYDRLAALGGNARWIKPLARLAPTPNVAVVLDAGPNDPDQRVFAAVPNVLRVAGEVPERAHHVVSNAVQRHLDSRSTQLRATALRLLLEPSSVDLDEVDWTELRVTAERGGVIVRLADALRQRGEPLPTRFQESAARACAHSQRVLELVQSLHERCTALGMPHVFLKTAEQYPDSGRDIDLLIAETAFGVDRRILDGLAATPRPRRFKYRIAGSRTYTAAHGIVVDIHHGRLGQLGEQARYARLLLANATLQTAGASRFPTPSAADHFLLLATQQVYGRPTLRLADVSGAITLLRPRESLPWDYVFATALSMGMLPAVGAYLGYVDRMHARLFSRPLLDTDLLDRFQSGDRKWLAREFDSRYPALSVVRRLYLRQVHATLQAGRWASVARLSLLPLLAAIAAGGHPHPKGARA